MMFFAATRRVDLSGVRPGTPERPRAFWDLLVRDDAREGPPGHKEEGLNMRAQQERNNALWTAARSCENGSLSVVRMSNEGVPYTQTVNSSGGEFAPFEKCFQEKAAPIWGAYCKAEPDSPSAGARARRRSR
jgi:hypothetical protein